MRSSTKSKAISKKGGKQARKRLQAPTVRRVSRKPKVKTTRGIKQASPELTEMLRLMNLAKGYELPELEDTTTLEFLLDPALPDPVRRELLDYIKQPDRWFQDWFPDPDTAPADWLRRWFPDFSRLDILPPEVRETYKVSSVVRHYDAIRQAAMNFRGLFEDKPIGHTFTITVLSTTDEEHKIRIFPVDPFMRAIKGVDRRYLRKCPVCDKFFYARRSNSVVCDPESPCADTYAKRQERKNAAERKRLADLAEENSKKKRAKTASKR